MLDGFETTKIQEVEPNWQVHLLGRPMRCLCCTPAERGGDFYDLALASGDSVAFFEVDKNTQVLAKPPEN